MGVIYASVPLDKEVKKYLDELEIDYSKVKKSSKKPSPNEILSVLKQFKNLTVASGFIRGAWQAQVENKSDEGRAMPQKLIKRDVIRPRTNFYG